MTYTQWGLSASCDCVLPSVSLSVAHGQHVCIAVRTAADLLQAWHVLGETITK